MLSMTVTVASTIKFDAFKTSTIKQPPTGKHHITQNVILGICTRDLNQIFNLTLGSHVGNSAIRKAMSQKAY